MKGYFQTWTLVSSIRSIKFIGEYLSKFIQYLCGIICGHEHSKTEWGYGGGDYADSWCRWCNKMIQIPKEEYHAQPGPKNQWKFVSINSAEGRKRKPSAA